MAKKFKISLKLTGLDIQIEGSKEDVPLMTTAIGNQIAGLLAPASKIIEGEITKTNEPISNEILESKNKPKKRRTSSQKNRNLSKSDNDESEMQKFIDLKHNSSKWGIPLQKWKTVDKSLWLLYILSEERLANELTSRIISDTFNRHFRQSGTIRPNNISRDFGKLKSKAPSLVSENTALSPSKWFLTQAGIIHAKELVEQALGKK